MSVNAATFQMRPNAQGFGVPRELWTGADQLTALGVVTGAPVVGNPVLENLAPSWNLPATINVPQSDSVDVRQYLTNGAGLTISVTNLPTGVTYNSGTESLEGAASGTSSGTATFTAGSAVDTATVALVEAPASDYTPTHYVTADAAGSGDGSIGNPWTLAQAMANAVAGNVVRVAPGVYTGSGGSYWNPTFSPSNSGTEGNPIVFYAQYPAAVNHASTELLSKLRNGGSTGVSVLGGKGYGVNTHDVVFDGFWLDQADGAYPVASNGQLCVGGGCDRISIKRCLFDRNNTPSTDNFAAVFIQQAEGTLIQDCFFRGASTSGHHNTAAVNTYNAESLTVEYCTFDACGCGVYLKADREGIGNSGTVRFNLFDGMAGKAFEVNEADPDIGGVDIYQNLALDCGMKWDWSSDTSGKNARVYNNTFVLAAGTDSNVEVFPSSFTSQITFRDNIVVMGGSQQYGAYFHDAGANPDDATWNYNLYYRASGSYLFRYNGTTYTGLSAWQAAKTSDANSVEANPAFVGSGDYTLQAGSPALTASSTGGPVGCYITGDETIGRRV